MGILSAKHEIAENCKSPLSSIKSKSLLCSNFENLEIN